MKKKKLTQITESSTKIFLYANDNGLPPSKAMNVFYNKRMELNRDISNLAINAYVNLHKPDDLLIIDSMAASGIGSIRMLKECQKIANIVINDINPEAVKLIKKNLKLNRINKTSNQIKITNKDANALFSEITDKGLILSSGKKKKPNVISIDPFGTPNLYIDSAFKTIQKSNALVCITATDTAVLFGVRSKACMRKYLSKPLRNEYSKEIGARILVQFIARIAAINKVGIIPLLTFYSGHFIRVFCLTFKNKQRISKFLKKNGYIIHCKNCGYRSSHGDNILHLPLECPMCGNKKSLDYAGPLWADKIHDINFINEILLLNEKSKFLNKNRISKILTFARQEIDMPISYYNIHKLSQNLKLSSIPKISNLINILKEKGYKSSRTHFDFLAIKTDMDLETLKNTLIDTKK
ncbi:MAG: tRNA (guanine(10)-N(2))-dimethyltransferase [Candidatus Hermodarchaeota archaeon]